MLICPHSDLRRSVAAAAAKGQDLLTTSSPGSYPDADAVLEQSPDICLVDVGTDGERALSLVKHLTESGVAVVALHTTNDSDLILRSLRCGATEFLSEPIDPEQISNAFERIARKSETGKAKNRTGRIWTIMPAKANYGSTTIACNLAVRLKRLEQRRVLLVDMDPLVGSVGFLLKQKSPFSIVDAVGGCENLDKDLWKKLTVSYSGIEILLGPEKPQFDRFPAAAAPLLFRFWREYYGTIVIDSPGPVSDWQIAVANSSDELLLVTTNELAAIHATQKAVSHLQAAGAERSRIRILVNRYERENGLSDEAIRTALNLEVFHVLPNDYAPVQKAVLDGKTVSPTCQLGKAIDGLCERLTGVTREAKKGWLPAFPRFLSGK